jgi:MFS transporter, MHS family, shikimate and dehydroshikimate transport protein
VVIGTFIRLRIDETPNSKHVEREGKVSRLPVLEAIRRHPKDLLIGLGARITEISSIYVLTIFGLIYAVTNLGLPRSLVLGAVALGARWSWLVKVSDFVKGVLMVMVSTADRVYGL